jgi:hypothetical protein
MNTNTNTNTTKTAPNAVIAFKPYRNPEGHYFTKEVLCLLSSSPSICTNAVERLTGAPFVPGLHDLAPLVRVVMQGVRRAYQDGDDDPTIFVRDLLEMCVEAGKAFFQPRFNFFYNKETDPVEYLAAMLENALEAWFTGPVLSHDPNSVAGLCSANNRQRAGHAARP